MNWECLKCGHKFKAPVKRKLDDQWVCPQCKRMFIRKIMVREIEKHK